jgi:hypothetical protein
LDGASLTQVHILTAEDAVHGHIVDAPDFGDESIFLEIFDGVHGHLADDVYSNIVVGFGDPVIASSRIAAEATGRDVIRAGSDTLVNASGRQSIKASNRRKYG